MTAAKKTNDSSQKKQDSSKKNNDSSNYQTNGGNIGPTGLWALFLLAPSCAFPPCFPPGLPWALPPPWPSALVLPWASLGPLWAPLPISPPPKAAEGEKPTTKLNFVFGCQKLRLKTNHFGAWGAQGRFEAWVQGGSR